MKKHLQMYTYTLRFLSNLSVFFRALFRDLSLAILGHISSFLHYTNNP